jgi:hypothetical protein
MVAFDKLETSHALYESNLNFALAHRINAEFRLRNLNIPESEVRLLQEYLTQNLGALAERTANPSVSNVVTDRHRVEHHHNGYSNIPSPRLSHMSLFNDGWWAAPGIAKFKPYAAREISAPLAKAQKEHADRTLPRSGRWPSPSEENYFKAGGRRCAAPYSPGCRRGQVIAGPSLRRTLRQGEGARLGNWSIRGGSSHHEAMFGAAARVATEILPSPTQARQGFLIVIGRISLSQPLWHKPAQSRSREWSK